MLPIEAEWHDKIFPYSELKNTKQDTEEFAAANGMTKTYICFPVNTPCYSPGMPIMIYRKSSDEYNRGFKSVVTSYGTIVRSEPIKQNWSYLKSFEEYVKIVGNKSVFTHKLPTLIIKRKYLSKPAEPIRKNRSFAAPREFISICSIKAPQF